MASSTISSRGRSPHSPYDFGSDTDDQWHWIDQASTSTGSIGVWPSPASGSLGPFAVIGHNTGGNVVGGAAMSPGGGGVPASPIPINLDEPHFPVTTGSYDPQHQHHHDLFAAAAAGAVSTTAGSTTRSVSSLSFDPASSTAYMSPQDLLLGQHLQHHQQQQQQQQQQESGLGSAAYDDMAAQLFAGYPPDVHLSPLAEMQQAHPDLGIPSTYQRSPSEPAWHHNQMRSTGGDGGLGGGASSGGQQFVFEQFTAPPPSSVGSSSSTGALSPVTQSIRFENEMIGSGSSNKAPSPIRKVKEGKIGKKKRTQPPPPSPSAREQQQSQAGKFVIVTPNSISASGGRASMMFECFDAMRSQKGRKGPLANATKESALQVRRLGACFCCHARKVKCDKERPCRSCTKLMVHVPQVVCWQFQDFLPVLFPEFIRGHFRRDDMTRFIDDNIQSFTVNGVEQPAVVQLYSGARFESRLTIKAKFFTAKNDEVLHHWHTHVDTNGISLHSQSAVPLGLDAEEASRKDEIRKVAKAYIQSIMKEPLYVEQVTETFYHTDLPQKILHIVQNYATQSENPIVRKALAVYTSHYIMTRHLCLTPQTVRDLRHTNLVAQGLPWVTPRVLNRQIKAVIDEITLRDMTSLFEHFSKALKPKARKAWAPCLAAFLVLTLFMEAVETAADNFVISEAEINLQKSFSPAFRREEALTVNREIERLPFKQFAYQFHQIYQTHSRDASTKAFNPLVDDSFAQQGELDPPALEMVNSLKQFLQRPSWDELDFLTMDPILPNKEDHPFPRDISWNYTGRLLSKFLLSFEDEKYIFEGGF